MASTTAGHTCVLCDEKLKTKAELQEHFRDHANGKIKPRQRRPGYLAQDGSRRNGQPPTASQAQKTNQPPNQQPNQQPKQPPNQQQGQQQPQQQEPRQDEEEVTWQCDNCSETFPTVTAAITHKFKVHPDSSTKYFCPYCGQQFPLKMSFDRHIKTHKEDVVGAKEVPCSDCGAMFYLDKARDFHFNSVHCRSLSIIQPKFCPPPSMKIDVSQSGEMRSCYYCHLCGTEYTVKYNLMRHLDRHDDGERHAVPSDMIRCTPCQSVFFNRRAYSAHLLRHREGDLFVATEEQRLQVVDRVDQDLDVTRIPHPLERYVPGEGSAASAARIRQTAAAAAAARTKRPAERAEDGPSVKSVRAS